MAKTPNETSGQDAMDQATRPMLMTKSPNGTRQTITKHRSARMVFFERQIRATSILMTVALVFISTWMPQCDIFVYGLLAPQSASQLDPDLVLFCTYAYILNHCLNPVLYHCLSPKFRRLVWQRCVSS
jgi:hypothetical protein